MCEAQASGKATHWPSWRVGSDRPRPPNSAWLATDVSSPTRALCCTRSSLIVTFWIRPLPRSKGRFSTAWPLFLRRSACSSVRRWFSRWELSSSWRRLERRGAASPQPRIWPAFGRSLSGEYRQWENDHRESLSALARVIARKPRTP